MRWFSRRRRARRILLPPSDLSPLRAINARVAVGADELRIAGGRIVDALPAGTPARTLDARGRLVLPAAIDMHTHVLTRGPALAREAFGEDRALLPEINAAAQAYQAMGYGLFVDAAVPADEIPAVRQAEPSQGASAAWLLELAMDELVARRDEAALARWLDEQLQSSDALGLKLVMPATATLADESHLIKRLATALARLTPGPRLHIHAPGLGQPGSAAKTIELIRTLDGLPVHLAHVQFYAYGQTQRGQHTSAADHVAEALAGAQTLTADVGCISFGRAMMVSRDHALARQLGRLMNTSPVTRDGWSVMPLAYHHDNPVHAVQWATGLELILRSPRMDHLSLTVDHPNGGAMTHLPALLHLLMDAPARQAALDHAHPAARQRTGLAQLDRELTLDEALTLTRRAPAAALGLRDRGHLGPGAAADCLITQQVHARPDLIVKGGEVVQAKTA